MIEDIGKDYNDNGFVVIKNLIEQNDIKKFSQIAKRHDHKSSANKIVDYFYDYLRFLDLRLYPKFIKFIDLKYFIDSYYLISKSKKKNWKSLISSIYKKNSASVSRIDSYISKRSDEDILEWHTDQAFGGATHPPEFFGNIRFLLLGNVHRMVIFCVIYFVLSTSTKCLHYVYFDIF